MAGEAIQHSELTAAARVALFLLVTYFGAFITIITEVSKNQRNEYDYETVTVPICTEFLKLVITCVLLIRDDYRRDDRQGDAYNSLLYLIEVVTLIKNSLRWEYLALALGYAVQNNMYYHVLQYLDPGTFQVVSNARIPLSALLLYLLLGKTYSLSQLAGIGMLTIGALSYCLGNLHRNSITSTSGYIMASVSALFASISAVYNEYLLKRGLKHSINVQNAQMYFYGIILNFVLLCMKNPDLSHFFKGYTFATAIMVTNNAAFGISVGYMLRYCDNNIRSFGSICSMLICSAFSYFYIRLDLPTGYFFSMLSVIAGLLMYTGVIPCLQSFFN